MAWEHGGPDFQARFDKSTDKLDSETTRSEWGGLFREDISQAFPFELVQAASFRGTWNCRAAARHLQIV